MTRKLILATVAALVALPLGACSRSEPEQPVVDNVAEPAPETPAPPPPAPAPLPAPTEAEAAPAQSDMNIADETPDAPPADIAPAPDEQMMDDASATGMTARASRGERAADNTTTPESMQP